jgi:hypothetical protein
VIDWASKQDLEEKARRKEVKRTDKRNLLKIFVICGVPAAIAATMLIYEIAQSIPDIQRYGLNWPF